MENATSSRLHNSFAMKLISEMYLKPDFADVHFTFSSGNQTERVPAHKAILATASPVFAAMFYGQLKEADAVQIEDSTADAFKEFLQLVYLPEITVTMANHAEVLSLVDKYGMLDCVGTLVPLIKRHLTFENLATYYQLAISLNSLDLKNFCERLITEFTYNTLKSESFLQCPRELVQQILQFDSLNCFEIDLFEACMAWAKLACQQKRMDENNAENLKTQLGNCFHLIRFGAMDGLEISNVLSNPVYKNLFNQDELIEIRQRKFDSNFQSKIFNSVPRSKVFNDSKTLTCFAKDYKHESVYYIKDQESTWFSTNEPILLTTIYFCRLKTLSGYGLSNDTNANMEIIEYDSSTIPTVDVPFKVFHKLQRPYIDQAMFAIPASPVIISPTKVYEIRWVFPDNKKNRLPHHAYECPSSDIKVNDQITITFHQHPLDNGSARCGLVSHLQFHPL